MKFSDFYQSYILSEAILMNIPNKVLGMRPMEELPGVSPYGFWVDKSGNFIEVSQFRHEETADDLIDRAFDYAKGNNIELHFATGGPYTKLFAQGWMRVVSVNEYNDDIRYEIKSDPSPHQIKFLKRIQELYNATDISRS